jgi:uncharacterized protein (UPF0305 family)
MSIHVLFSINGKTQVVDQNGERSDLQKNWIILFAKFLESKGIDPLGTEFVLPGGMSAKIFKTNDGDYRCEINSSQRDDIELS